MYPSYCRCSECLEKFPSLGHDAFYYLGDQDSPTKVSHEEILEVLGTLAWCVHCNRLTYAEDIESIEVFEMNMAKARLGHTISYPVYIEDYGRSKRPSYMPGRFWQFHLEEAEFRMEEFRRYMRWRYERKTLPKALCCGSHYHFLIEGPGPWVRHDTCQYGVLKEIHLAFASFAFPSRLYSTEGWLIGVMTEWNEEERSWNVEPMNYSCALERVMY